MYNRNIVPIIYYHSVSPVKNSNWYKSYLTFKLKYFEDLLRFLCKQRFEFLFLDEYFSIKNNDPSYLQRKNKKILLTFDDGYLDNYVYVFPLLKKYRVKATIFVSPEFIQTKEQIRPSFEDIWTGRISEHEIESFGFLSWNELLEMEKSGLVDIQSHTLTHTKYFCSDIIKDFHNPKSDYLNHISNLFPERKPYYITDPEFIKLIPFGTPLFQEESSLIVRKVTINPEFLNESVEILKDTDWNNYNFKYCLGLVKTLYDSFKKQGILITHIEDLSEYKTRIRDEIFRSKAILEQKLNKKISHCCWPHGAYNSYCHQVSREAGYESSSIVIGIHERNNKSDRFDRTGSGTVLNNRLLTLIKGIYKIYSYLKIPPFSWIMTFYYFLYYGKAQNKSNHSGK